MKLKTAECSNITPSIRSLILSVLEKDENKVYTTPEMMKIVSSKRPISDISIVWNSVPISHRKTIFNVTYIGTPKAIRKFEKNIDSKKKPIISKEGKKPLRHVLEYIKKKYSDEVFTAGELADRVYSEIGLTSSGLIKGAQSCMYQLKVEGTRKVFYGPKKAIEYLKNVFDKKDILVKIKIPTGGRDGQKVSR